MLKNYFQIIFHLLSLQITQNFLKLKKEKIVPPGQTLFNLSHRADFIEFKNEKITIVELSGNISCEYEEQLVDKEKDYFKITKNNSYVLYKRNINR